MRIRHYALSIPYGMGQEKGGCAGKTCHGGLHLATRSLRIHCTYWKGMKGTYAIPHVMCPWLVYTQNYSDTFPPLCMCLICENTCDTWERVLGKQAALHIWYLGGQQAQAWLVAQWCTLLWDEFSVAGHLASLWASALSLGFGPEEVCNDCEIC